MQRDRPVREEINEINKLLEPAYQTNLVPEEIKTSSNCSKTLGKIAYGTSITTLLLAAGAADTITFTLGLMKQEEDFLGFVPKTNVRIYALTVFYFAQYMVITAPFVHEGLDDTIQIFKKRKIPSEWEKLSRNKEMIAASLGLSFAIYSVTGETTVTYGFWKDLGASPPLAGVLALLYGNTSLLGESHKAWANLRNIFVFFHKGESCCPASFKFSKIPPYTLALFSAVGAMLLSYDGMTEELSIKNAGWRIFLFAFAFSKGFSNISLNGQINVNAFEELFNRAPPDDSNPLIPLASKPFKISAGLGALIFGSIVTESFGMIYRESLATAALPFSMPTWIPPILGYGIALSDGVNVTYGTYEFLEILRKCLYQLIGRCKQQKKNNTSIDLEMGVRYKPLADEPTPYRSGNTSVTFAPSKVTPPSISHKSRCVIL